MQEVDLALVKKKSLRSVVALVQRSLFLKIFDTAAFFILGFFLHESDFGVFGIVMASMMFLNYFSDIGLAAALIQKKEALSQNDLRTTFTIQQLLVGTVSIVAFVFSSAVADFYAFGAGGLFLFRALVLSFFLSSLKTIPSVLLERNLEFHRLVIPQIAETIVYDVLIIVLAAWGCGVASFAWGMIVRGIVGLTVLWIISPWRVSLGIDKSVAKRLFRFGIPFQWNSFIALLKDDLLILVLGKVFTLTELGYITWAKKLAEIPLRLIMDNVIRVTFPAFSRLQSDASALRSAVEKTLFGISSAVFPMYVVLFFFISPFMELIPKYQKWEPTLLSIYLFGFTSIIACLTTPLVNTLNAIGKITVTLMFMIGWTLATWTAVFLLVPSVGFHAYGWALAGISLSIVIVILVVRQYVAFSFVRSVRSPLLAALIQACTYWFLLSGRRLDVFWIAVTGIVGGILYAVTVWELEKKRIIALFHAAISK